MKYGLVVGARPNYIKMYPIYKRFVENNIPCVVYNTGQHFTANMGVDVLGDDYLGVVNLYLNGESFYRYVDILQNRFCVDNIDNVICFGDVDSSLCGALASIKRNIKLIHIEAGLRSWENDLPEEKNRIIIDSISDILFLTEPSARENLINEGFDNNKMFLVGNTMIDTLLDNIDRIKSYKNEFSDYYVLTLHRGYNVDNIGVLKKILGYINDGVDCKVIYPIHHRVKYSIEDMGFKNIMVIDPLPYIDFLGVVYNSLGAFTDSGGVQEEASYLGKPCLTFRKSTERPITIEKGSNVLVDDYSISLYEYIDIIKKKSFMLSRYELWDGRASYRILNILLNSNF